ncbi:hypothetical protein RchiOBHm_Chr2g0138651 [Rosa chinensis]|uniref:Uncharacterized protein n=1 Tax=Rosa chinensis TaxID=74649 RepID=A0A2P6RWY0_ROSCH|nr:hypothetical protein RchiOBHm_Chr2g0138651 [Rosa chinensis]
MIGATLCSTASLYITLCLWFVSCLLLYVHYRIFHSLMGDDGHGYCRTFGAGVPRSLVYSKESNISQSTDDLVQKITEQVRQEFHLQLQQLHARIHFLQNKDSSTESPRQVADATSGQEILRVYRR